MDVILITLIGVVAQIVLSLVISKKTAERTVRDAAKKCKKKRRHSKIPYRSGSVF